MATDERTAAGDGYLGRLPVVARGGGLVGVITRGDLLRAHRLRLEPASGRSPVVEPAPASA
jgi:CBS domain-containing protein